MSKRLKHKGGQPINKIYSDFLDTFKATPQMSIDEIQQLFKKKVMKDFDRTATSTSGSTTGAQDAIIQQNLINYVNMITQVQQSLTARRSALNQQQSQLNKERTDEVIYQKLLRDTGNVVSKFDKYLLKYISFIMINPKKNALLNNLSQNILKIIETYNVALTQTPPAGQEYSVFLISNSNNIQNKIMIEVIQKIIENTRPIYQEFQNNPLQLSTDVPDTNVKKILTNMNNSLQTSTAIQTEFKKNISNWIDLLTEVIKLNSVTILASSINTKTITSHLGEIILDYQTAVTHIQTLTGKIQPPNATVFNSNKKYSPIFIQELSSEVFRWGMAIFKIYKHATYLYGPAETIAPNVQTTPAISVATETEY